MTEVKPTVVEALSAVMDDVQAVRKAGFNEQQKFNFRGIDAVVNAVGPALRKHGVVVVPLAEDVQHEAYSTRSGAQMRNTTVRVRFRFHGPAGDSIEAVTIGEASDAGDKSVSKAHSVAFRTALLQALCIPTDEPDPDASSYERAEPEPDAGALRGRIAALGKAKGKERDQIAADFAGWAEGVAIQAADPPLLAKYIDAINDGSTLT